MKSIRAYYKYFDSASWGSRCHLDNGSGKPLCGGEKSKCMANNSMTQRPRWVQSSHSVSCSDCLKMQARNLDIEEVVA